MGRWAAAVALLVLLVPGARPAAAQDWVGHFDFPVDASFRAPVGGGQSDLPATKTQGAFLGLLTPFHVGFGLEGFKVAVKTGGQVFDLAVSGLDTYVDLPVPFQERIDFSLGFGAAGGTFKPNTVGNGSGGTPNTLQDINFREFFAALGVKLPWSLAARLSYREYNGELTVRNRSRAFSETHSARLRVSTLGVGYRF